MNTIPKNELVALAFAGLYDQAPLSCLVSAQDNLLTTSLYTDYQIYTEEQLKVMVGFNTELYKQNYGGARRDDVISDEALSIDASIG